LKDRMFFHKKGTGIREEKTVLFRGPAGSGYTVLFQKRVEATPAKAGYFAGLLQIAPSEFNEIPKIPLFGIRKNGFAEYMIFRYRIAGRIDGFGI